MAAMNVPRPLNERTGYGVAEHLPVTAPDPPPDNTQETLNKWIKTQPWYQEALKAWKITPGSPTLNPTQRLQLQEAAFRAGAQPASTYAIGNHGEFEDTHELAGKVIALTIGGIAGGVGAAGLLAGGGGAAAAGGGTTAAVAPAAALEGTAAGTGAISTAAGLGTAAPLASSTIAPTVGSLAPAAASSGAVAAAAPVAAGAGGASILSKTLGALTTPAVLGTIASGAFGVYGASKAADSQTDAAKIIADANTAAAKLQADASTQAAQIQAKSTADALDFAKQGYADQSSRYEQNQEQLSPYTGAGGAAVTKLSQLLGLGTPAPYVSAVKPTAPVAPQAPQTQKIPPGSEATGPNSFKPVPMNPTQLTGTIASLAQSAAQTPSPSQQMVTLRAPTGETTQKPASEVQHWVSLGAQPVQQGAAV